MAGGTSSALSESGWYLSDEGIEACTNSSDKVNISDVILIALNTDLRTIGKKFLPSDINGGKVEKLEGPCVLQIQKIRNVAAPKDNEESQAAPRMLRLQMTDGHTSCIAIEYNYMSKISLNTPPGTKIKLSGIVEVKNGFLLLDDSNTVVLGGEVEHLIEKWELQRSLSKHNRSNIGTEGGPPPFVPFGQKCVSSVQVDSRELDQRKTLQMMSTAKAVGDNDEFEKQRTAAIAEVAKSKETKTFGGGGGSTRSNLNVSAGGNRNREVFQKEKITKPEGKNAGVYRELLKCGLEGLSNHTSGVTQPDEEGARDDMFKEILQVFSAVGIEHRAWRIKLTDRMDRDGADRRKACEKESDVKQEMIALLKHQSDMLAALCSP